MTQWYLCWSNRIPGVLGPRRCLNSSISELKGPADSGRLRFPRLAHRCEQTSRGLRTGSSLACKWGRKHAAHRCRRCTTPVWIGHFAPRRVSAAPCFSWHLNSYLTYFVLGFTILPYQLKWKLNTCYFSSMYLVAYLVQRIHCKLYVESL